MLSTTRKKERELRFSVTGFCQFELWRGEGGTVNRNPIVDDLYKGRG